MKDYLNTILFGVTLGVFLALIIILPDDLRILEIENRNLNKAPRLSLQTALNGEFATSFEGYIADRVAWRTDLIMVAKGIENSYGFQLQGAPTVVMVNPLQTQGVTAQPGPQMTNPPAELATTEDGAVTREDAEGDVEEGDSSEGSGDVELGLDDGDESQVEASAMDSGVQPTIPVAQEVEPFRVGSLLVFPDALMEIFDYNEYGCVRYAQAIEAYAVALQDKARVFNLLVPTQIEFVPERFQSVTDSQLVAIERVYKELDLAIPVDAYTPLKAHIAEYIYFRSDHHWTALGAYYAYLAYAEAAGLAPVIIDSYISYDLPGFLGYLYNMSPSTQLRDNPDIITYYLLADSPQTSSDLIYLPGADQALTYRVFLGGDYPLYEIETSVGNGRTCVVIKDSYANAFVPWLVPHYERLLVIDPRHYEGSVSQLLADYEEIDLIVLDYTLVTRYPEYADYIDGIR